MSVKDESWPSGSDAGLDWKVVGSIAHPPHPPPPHPILSWLSAGPTDTQGLQLLFFRLSLPPPPPPTPIFLGQSQLIVQELCESRWPSWAVRPNEPSGFSGRKDLLNRASALVWACP